MFLPTFSVFCSRVSLYYDPSRTAPCVKHAQTYYEYWSRWIVACSFVNNCHIKIRHFVHCRLEFFRLKMFGKLLANDLAHAMSSEFSSRLKVPVSNSLVSLYVFVLKSFVDGGGLRAVLRKTHGLLNLLWPAVINQSRACFCWTMKSRSVIVFVGQLRRFYHSACVRFAYREKFIARVDNPRILGIFRCNLDFISSLGRILVRIYRSLPVFGVNIKHI